MKYSHAFVAACISSASLAYAAPVQPSTPYPTPTPLSDATALSTAINPTGQLGSRSHLDNFEHLPYRDLADTDPELRAATPQSILPGTDKALTGNLAGGVSGSTSNPAEAPPRGKHAKKNAKRNKRRNEKRNTQGTTTPSELISAIDERTSSGIGGSIRAFDSQGSHEASGAQDITSGGRRRRPEREWQRMRDSRTLRPEREDLFVSRNNIITTRPPGGRNSGLKTSVRTHFRTRVK